MSFKLTGDKEMRNTIKRIARNFPGGTARALFQEIDEVETPEVKRRTPVQTGALRASEYTTPPQTQGKKIWVAIAAGGPSAPYAIKVHEDLEAFHPVGQAKFIESVLNESAPFLMARVGRRIDLSKM